MFEHNFLSFGKALPLALVAWILKSRLLLGAAGAAALGALCFFSYRGHVTGFGPGVAPLAAGAAAMAAAEFPGYDETGLNPVVVFPFVGPKGAAMADLIRDAIDASGRYDVIGKGVVESTIRLLQMDLPQLGEEEAREYGSDLKAGAVVTGEMIRVDELADPPVLRFSAAMRSVAGEERWTLEYPDPRSAAVAEQGGEAEAAPVPDGWDVFFGVALVVILFAALALCTPFLLYPLSRNILARESNFANAAMLFVFAALNAGLLAYLRPYDGWSTRATFAVVIAFVVALWLNYLSCSILERGRK